MLTLLAATTHNPTELFVETTVPTDMSRTVVPVDWFIFTPAPLVGSPVTFFTTTLAILIPVVGRSVPANEPICTPSAPPSTTTDPKLQFVLCRTSKPIPPLDDCETLMVEAEQPSQLLISTPSSPGLMTVTVPKTTLDTLCVESSPTTNTQSCPTVVSQ